MMLLLLLLMLISAQSEHSTGHCLIGTLLAYLQQHTLFISFVLGNIVGMC